MRYLVMFLEYIYGKPDQIPVQFMGKSGFNVFNEGFVGDLVSHFVPNFYVHALYSTLVVK